MAQPAEHSHSHDHTTCPHDKPAINTSTNPWNNPFCMPQEPLLINPINNQLEDKQHQNKRLELEHFYSIVHSFEYYATWQFLRFQSKNYDYNMLNPGYKKITPFMSAKFTKIRQAIIQNQSFLTLITQQCSAFTASSAGPNNNMNPSFIKLNLDEKPSSLNMDKVRSTLKQIARDWSVFGAQERKNCYAPILHKLTELFPNRLQRPNIKILNPGCGLGRLPWEIAKLGFCSQGNEFSYFMLLASHFMLNKCFKQNMFTIYPFCDQPTNQWSVNEQLRYCKIPDVSPAQLMFEISDLKRNDLLSMVAGDFVEIYARKQHFSMWDVIVSCFFIDTAHNILQYLSIFNQCLKVNGFVVNLGPLLYHFEDESNPDPSIELTYEEIVGLLPVFGFKMVYERRKNDAVKCGYAQSENSMLQMHYNCPFWVAQKVRDVDVNQFQNQTENKQDNINMKRETNLSGHNIVGGNHLPSGECDKHKETQNQQFLTNNLQFDNNKNANNQK